MKVSPILRSNVYISGASLAKCNKKIRKEWFQNNISEALYNGYLIETDEYNNSDLHYWNHDLVYNNCNLNINVNII